MIDSRLQNLRFLLAAQFAKFCKKIAVSKTSLRTKPQSKIKQVISSIAVGFLEKKIALPGFSNFFADMPETKQSSWK